MTDNDKLELVTKFLLAIGEDPSREGLIDTPKRVVKSWAELYGGYAVDPNKILTTDFADGVSKNMIILKNISFTSTCEHHVIPIVGVAHVAYIPNKKIVGISKLARLVDCVARRLQIQEKMTIEIINTIVTALDPIGAAVLIDAQHMCMTSRGVNKQNVSMVTKEFFGTFENQDLKAEFLNEVKN